MGAREEGVKEPVRRMPFAWRGRKPGCEPEIWWSVETRSRLVWSVWGSVGRGMVGVFLEEEWGLYWLKGIKGHKIWL